MRSLFLASAPRSGSTFLRTALNRHPRILMTNQAGWLAWLRRCLQFAEVPASHEWDDQQGTRFVGVLTDESRAQVLNGFRDNLSDLIAALARRFQAPESTQYFGDKIHSPQMLEFAATMIPNSRLVVLVRDPRDTLVSTYRFQEKASASWHSANLEERCNALVSFARHVTSALSNRPHTLVRYEELVADPMGEIARVLAELELSMAPGISAWLDSDAKNLFGTHGTSSSPTASVGRWRKDLAAPHRATALQMLAPAVAALGYGD